MNKIIILSLFVLIASVNVFSQEKRTIAVAPTQGNSDGDMLLMISSALEEGVYRSGNYKLVARGAAYDQALKEFEFQNSGAVDDSKLVEFGRASGAELVCFASISKISDKIYRISYKLIEVKTSEILNINSETIKNGLEGVIDAADAIANKLFGSTLQSKNNRTINSNNTTPTHTQFNPNSNEPDMVYVEGGTFLMGCTGEQGADCYENEMPAHSVTLSSFSISRYEITQTQWQKIMGTNPSSNARGGNYPVTNVSWEDAQEFCKRLSAATGKQYRLPTEAEWEYAARGGNRSRGYKYSGSNNLNDVGWYENNSGKNTAPVGEKHPNELGIYDMSGNVYEWCLDKYDDYSTSMHTEINPKNDKKGYYRVFRGGSWRYDAEKCRVAYRYYYRSNGKFKTLGFRVVLP
ncbi:MAG: SUMF1/EgtB/PvdO family nonheme iron enzyme [Bacteroidales bacterium]|jgi:formylglycine-generating enzyme required for sulfatase activity|nr:SUMF1/EgtB/PvdO family nonheme iron enzyme [Bacteroidales bacterium]